MALALIIGLGFGGVGLFALAIMVWLSHQPFGIDSSGKHGISVRDTSRLGGLAIVLFVSVIFLVFPFSTKWRVPPLFLSYHSITCLLSTSRVPHRADWARG